MANPTTSIVTFTILSPDASLSYDRIRVRLEEYRTLLASDSDTIELSTENGKTVVCRKQANEMEDYLDRAESLLRGVVQSRDISSLLVLRHLCELAEVLDELKLYDECRLTGNCALDLAEALVRRSLEFRHEQAWTLALIGRLYVYQPRARTLFIQAVSISEEVAANNPSDSNKMRLLLVLGRAGYWASDHLRARWLGRAVHLMTKELPPAMVHPEHRGIIYYNYGIGLSRLMQYPNAIEAYNEAISIRRTLANDNPAKYNRHLVRTLMNMGILLHGVGKYGDAIVALKEALEICTTMSAQDPLRYNEQMARILYNYGLALGKSNQVSEAAAVEKRAISLIRNLAQTKNEWTKWLCYALDNYGSRCGSLGQHIDAVVAYQESIPLRHALAATDSEEERNLITTLHDITYCFLALNKHAEANAAANEALERNHGRALERCPRAPNFQLCFVCKRAMITDSKGDGSSPLPFCLTNSTPPPAEHSGAGHTPAEISTSATSAHIPLTNAARRLGPSQPGVAPEAPVPVLLDPAAPSHSCLPSNQPHFQHPMNLRTRTPKRTGETGKVSVHRKKVQRLSKGNRGNRG